MIKSKIQQYLKTCSQQIVKRGREIFHSGAVTHCSYEVYQDMGGGFVSGSTKYTVAVNNIFDEEYEIETYCDCPYDWDDVCKHQVAVLLALQEKFEADFAQAPNQKMGTGELLLDRQIFENYEKSAGINAVSVQPIAISETSVDFELDVKTNYWQKETVPVRISFADKAWRIDNCCKTSFNAICVHQSAVIYYIRKHWRGFDFFHKIENLYEEKEHALQAYHLPAETNFDSFFKLRFNAKDFEFRFIPKDKSFRSKDDLRQLVSILKTNKEKSQQVSVPQVEKENIGFGLGFVFHHRSRRSNDFAVQVISGKMNKDRTKLVNSFEVYMGTSWIPENLRIFRENINYLIMRSSHAEYPEAEYNVISAAFVKDIGLISSQHCFENQDPYVASKSGLKPMYIQPQPLEISFELDKKQDFYHLVARIRQNNELIEFSPEMEIVCDHFLRLDRYFFIIPDYLTFSTAKTLLQAPELIIHEREKAELLLILDELSRNHEIELNGLVEVKELQLNQPSFQVYLSEEQSFMIIKPEVMYEGGERFSLMAGEQSWSFDPETEIAHNITRNLEAENGFRKLLFDFDPDFDPETGLTYYYKSYDDLKKGKWFFDFFAFCEANNIEVLGVKNLKKLSYNPHPANISLGLSSNIDWFEAHLKVSFGNEAVSLLQVRAALERRENFVKLGDGTMGILPEKWIRKLSAVLRAGEVRNEEIHISKLKFNLIDELFEEIDNLEVQQEIMAKKNRLRAFQGIDAVEIPKIVKAKLRDYQKEGFYWMNFLDEFCFGGCLADDMGLGKTVQLITFLAAQKVAQKGTSLVVVPKSLLFNWSAEIDKFCPTLKYLHYHGNNRVFDPKLFEQYDVVITTYNTVAIDIAKLKTFQFNYAILDESQAIKNPVSKRYKSACLLKARNRIVATGTPVENNTFDLYAQFNFLNPGLFGTQKHFKEQYSSEIDGKGDIQRANELKQIIHPFLLRRTKQQVANDLPEKSEQILMVEMGDKQRKVYDHYLQEIRDYILTKVDENGINNSKMYVLEGLTKLRQICNSPALIKKSEFDCRESAKIDLLLEQLIPLVKTNKVLVFSQFTSMLALIQERLEAEKISFSYLDGQTNQRQELVDHFNANESNRVFLISLKAGGTGLNLTSADYVFLVDPWWNPAAEAQAIDRTHRIGQKNHVFAYKMICENSIEEKILQLQQKKKLLSEDLIQAQENFVKGLKRSDIEVLFS